MDAIVFFGTSSSVAGRLERAFFKVTTCLTAVARIIYRYHSYHSLRYTLNQGLFLYIILP